MTEQADNELSSVSCTGVSSDLFGDELNVNTEVWVEAEQIDGQLRVGSD